MSHWTQYARRFVGALVVILLFTPASSSASGQNGDPPCTFDTSAKAKSGKTNFVRAFAACGGSITFPSPNSFIAATLTDACAPATPLSVFQFGPKGACSVKSKLKTFFNQQIAVDEANACFPDDSVPSCSVITTKAKCQDIRNADGTTLINETADQAGKGGWKLTAFARATFDDRLGGGAITSIDFPVTFRFPPAKKDRLKAKFNANAALFDLLGFGSALPPCTQFETLDVAILDSNFSPFARRGLDAGPGN